ncbi:MAG: sulfite exporter TauE/SafE family protein [Formosimonas sp.]
MTVELIALLAVLFFAIATLYASVGHAGASGYLAVMILLGVAPHIMRPTALLLNVAVAGLLTVQLWRSRSLDGPQLVPLLIGSIPAALVGAAFKLSNHTYFTLLALVMLTSALLIFNRTLNAPSECSTRRLPAWGAVLLGAAIGGLSGMTGTGGGIFLSPLLILFGWANMRQTAALSAPFILFNSLAGLSGLALTLNAVPPMIWGLIAPVLLGGYCGARLATQYLPSHVLLRLLSLVMLISGFKLLL